MVDSSPIAGNYLKVSSSDDGFTSVFFLKDSLVFLKSAILPEHLLFPNLQVRILPDPTVFLSPILLLNWLGRQNSGFLLESLLFYIELFTMARLYLRSLRVP